MIESVQTKKELNMAFENRNLSVLAYANGFTLWHHKTADNLAQVMDGYFNPVADLMAVGDMIILNTADFNGMMVVSEINNKNVKLSSK